MQNEVLKAILVLKDYKDDKRLKDIKEDLQRSYNLYIIEMLSTISQYGKALGYKEVQELIKDSQEIINSLEKGQPNWSK